MYGDERMFATLAEQIPKLAPGPFPPAKFAEELGKPSTTLYVTTTLLNGETSEFSDSFGTLVQDCDRRGVFTFTETELADDDTAPALALAARSSASFPVAFEPSFIPFGDETPKKGRVPARPAMARFIDITRSHWAADGGLLDNQPIDVLLKRIFDRLPNGRFAEYSCLSNRPPGPAPDLVQAASPDNVDQPLGLLDGLLKDLAAVTTQSIGGPASDPGPSGPHGSANGRQIAPRGARGAWPDSRLLTPPLLADYGKREATKQAQALTTALLRLLSTWPPGSSTLTDTIPKAWQSELVVGGNAEKVCRRTIKESILLRWSQPLTDRRCPRVRSTLRDTGKRRSTSQKVVRSVSSRRHTSWQRTKRISLPWRNSLKEFTRPTSPLPIDLAKLVRDACTDERPEKGHLRSPPPCSLKAIFGTARCQQQPGTGLTTFL